MHWLIQGADSANHVQNQTTRYLYMVKRQRKTENGNIVYVEPVAGAHTQAIE